MDDNQETAWQSIGNLPVVERSTQGSISSETLRANEQRAVQFSDALMPCLSLASGVGMSKQDQRVWLNAAYRALEEYPMDLIRTGALAAMKTVDHPSKIIPTIINAIRDEWSFRKRTAHLPPAPPIDPGQLRLADTPPVTYTDEQLAGLAKSDLGKSLLSMLLAKRNITRDQHDTAMASNALETPIETDRIEA